MKAPINFTVRMFITFGINFSLPLDCTNFCYGLCIIIACYNYSRWYQLAYTPHENVKNHGQLYQWCHLGIYLHEISLQQV